MVQRFHKKDSGIKLSDNFRLGEFMCKCARCTEVQVDDELVGILQKIRDYFGVPVNINSGYRCAEHNAEVGGDPGSHHMKGMAADIVVEGIEPAEVANYAESMGVQRIGLYSGFVHIGSGTVKRFWKGSGTNPVDTFGGAPVQTFTVEIAVLKHGCKGDEVRALQTQLAGWGCKIDVDGSFGPVTEAAVKRYQQDNGLTVDGKAGPQTRKHMLGIS